MATVRMSEKEAIKRGILMPPPQPPPQPVLVPATQDYRPFTVMLTFIAGWIIGFWMSTLFR